MDRSCFLSDNNTIKCNYHKIFIGGKQLITLASIQQVEEFLTRCCTCIQDKERITFIPRSTSLKTLNDLGISIADALFMVEEMTYENYYRGPSPERDKRFEAGNMWEFGIEIDEDYNDIYVKLKEASLKQKITCLSFHECRFPIAYPYKNAV